MEQTGGKANKVGEGRANEAQLFNYSTFLCEFSSTIELQLVVDTVNHSQRLVPAQSGRAPARLVVQASPNRTAARSLKFFLTIWIVASKETGCDDNQEIEARKWDHIATPRIKANGMYRPRGATA